ncbi:unnamed protein product, partial [Musa banksii]
MRRNLLANGLGMTPFMGFRESKSDELPMAWTRRCWADHDRDSTALFIIGCD